MPNAPATCGVAIDVPSKLANPVGGTDETMSSPGARTETNDARLEKKDTELEVPVVSPVEPTLTAVEMQAGAETAFV
jgi:hypothetical protein